LGRKRTLSFSFLTCRYLKREGEWSSETTLSVVVHFMLDQRRVYPPYLCKSSAINDLSCSFAIFIYNMRMQQRDILVRKVQSAIAYLETIQEKYQDKEAPLKVVQLLQAVVGVLQEIRREVLLQELTSVLHNEAISAATRKEKVVKIFQSLA
jgi:DNA-binding FrmR family transcriptional regulator